MGNVKKFFLISVVCLLPACRPSTAGMEEKGNEDYAIEQNLKEAKLSIGTGDWETARVKAETTFSSFGNRLSAVQAAEMETLYISLASEPGLDFEHIARYALRIVALHERADSLDKESVRRYYEELGAVAMIQESYENSLAIVEAKKLAGKDSTYVFSNRK